LADSVLKIIFGGVNAFISFSMYAQTMGVKSIVLNKFSFHNSTAMSSQKTLHPGGIQARTLQAVVMSSTPPFVRVYLIVKSKIVTVAAPVSIQ
jgi:hypothetical protein